MQIFACRSHLHLETNFYSYQAMSNSLAVLEHDFKDAIREPRSWVHLFPIPCISPCKWDCISQNS
jgi:hypothetical protein